MPNYTHDRFRYDYYLYIWYPGNTQYELYTANDLRVLTEDTGIICRTRHMNKLNKYNSKLLGKVYFTVERYSTGVGVRNLPRRSRVALPKTAMLYIHGEYTEEQLRAKADEYFDKKFGIHLSSLIDAIERGEVSIDDIQGVDINEFQAQS